ncbi:MAG TPA: hypothetical protein DEQ02_06935, partial [Ruminococcaceae bacterium]|nr:hypothetical protein [Oscillospiraceae bacterium]
FFMGDFGTALIFFVTFIVVAFLSTGDLRAIGLISAAAGLGALMLVSFRPYIIRRFSAWRHVWEFVNENGFQQTRTLMAIASGGLFGLGGGNGFLRGVIAAETDLAFGIVWEEWGLLIGLVVAVFYIAFLASSVSCAGKTRSSYYSIAACAASGLFIFQASLNIFGSTDILPLTGVTLPFISDGGSSMAASWGLLGFISAAVNNCMPKKSQIENVLYSVSRRELKRRAKQRKKRSAAV